MVVPLGKGAICSPRQLAQQVSLYIVLSIFANVHRFSFWLTMTLAHCHWLILIDADADDEADADADADAVDVDADVKKNN